MFKFIRRCEPSFLFMSLGNYYLQLLTHLSVIASVIPLVASIINFKFITKVLMPLFVLIVVSTIIEILNEVHLGFYLNNFYILHIFTIFEFTAITVFYRRFLEKNLSSILSYGLVVVFSIIAFLDYKINGLNSIDYFSISVESFIVTFYSLFLFYFVLKNLIFENLLESPIFWLNTAILLYFSGNLFLFIFSNYLIKSEPLRYHALWFTIHSIINILYNILLGVGFWKTKVK